MTVSSDRAAAGADTPTARAALLRYLVVGAWNTLFGYAVFALLTHLLMPRMAYGYVVAGLIASVLSITVAFLGHKHVVFRSQGGHGAEYLRFVAVYGASVAINTVLLPVFVWLLRASTSLNSGAPYVAGAMVMALNVLFTFNANRRFTFRG